MKKTLVILISMMFGLTNQTVFALDTAITAKEIPTQATEFIHTHFAGEEITFAKREREIIGTTYEVLLNSYTKIEFSKNGEWKEVECKNKEVPASIIPTLIASKIKELYPASYAVKIDRDSRNYEVKLNSGVELKFDLKFNLIDIDN